jgi:site-specific DNA recombinase
MEACKHYVASQGWLVRDDLLFIDDGHSGGSLDRPALSKLRRLVQAGEIDCVVVFKIDRLSRSVIDTVTLVLQEWEDLTYLKSAREPVDTTSAMGKQFFYMLVSYAEWERNIIRERMFSGKMRRAKEGRSPGFPAAYGYEKASTPGRLLLIEDEAAVVRLVFDLAEKGRTVRWITRYLNERGYRSRKGAPWGTSTVSKMLHNPIYTGKLVWGRTRINPRWKKAVGEARVKPADPYVEIESENFPAIVTPEQYERVQRLMAGNQKIQPAAIGSDHLLTGLLKCDKCGRAMQYNAYQHWAYYRCSKKQAQGLCDAPSVPAPLLEAEVVSALRERYEQLVHQLANAESSADEPQALEANIAAVTAQVTRLEAQEKRINQDYREQRLTADERRQLVAEVQAERGELLRVLADLNAELADVRDSKRVLAERMAVLDDMDLFRTLSADQQKHILRFFVKEIRAGKTEGGATSVTVIWKGEGMETRQT